MPGFPVVMLGTFSFSGKQNVLPWCCWIWNPKKSIPDPMWVTLVLSLFSINPRSLSHLSTTGIMSSMSCLVSAVMMKSSAYRMKPYLANLRVFLRSLPLVLSNQEYVLVFSNWLNSPSSPSRAMFALLGWYYSPLGCTAFCFVEHFGFYITCF